MVISPWPANECSEIVHKHRQKRYVVSTARQMLDPSSAVDPCECQSLLTLGCVATDTRVNSVAACTSVLESLHSQSAVSI